MTKYVVKQTAFLDGSLRDAGYVHEVEKPYDKWPAWAEAEGSKRSKPKKEPEKKLLPNMKNLEEEDLTKNPTIQL